jgi:ATP-dependent RNA helicase DBP3
LDFPNVDELVINYTFPLTIEDYVHRIARTGSRAGKTGGIQQQVMKQAGQEVPDERMKFGSTIIKKEHILYGDFGPKAGGVPMRKAVKDTFDSD